MKWKRLFFLFFTFLFFLKAVLLAWGASFQDITSTIKISVCGDGIIEGGEDCEGEDLGGVTCESLGYSGGTLTCDIDCSFDTYSCLAPTPTLQQLLHH